MNVEVKEIQAGVPALVDVPVRVQVWCRPDFQERQFECLRRSRPSIMFLCSDGGRNDDEWEKIMASRKIVERIDWDCTVHKLYFDENNGMYGACDQTSDYIRGQVDRCVWLEDDCLFADSFLPFCAEMLERYKDDDRVGVVCGMNHVGISKDVPYDYFFSRDGSVWGTASWIGKWGGDRSKLNDEYLQRCLEDEAKSYPGLSRKAKGYAENARYEGHTAGSEFWRAFNAYANGRLYIIPKKNMVCNIGCREDGAHAGGSATMPRRTRSLFNAEIYELEWPLTHPTCIIPDRKYLDAVNDILGRTRKASIEMKVEHALLVLRYQGMAAALGKALKRGKSREEK